MPFKYKEIFKILEKKAEEKIYGGNSLNSERNRVLVVGAGPVGLRSALEAQLLGARTVIVERRPKFTRNNVLKLWKFLIHDLKALGAKKFYGKFATGTINHINIRTLQVDHSLKPSNAQVSHLAYPDQNMSDAWGSCLHSLPLHGHHGACPGGGGKSDRRLASKVWRE